MHDPEARRRIGPSATVALVVVLAAVAVPVGATASASGRTITECTAVDDPGTYVLGANLTGETGECIHVRASNVRLDGDGHAIEVPEGGVGVRVGGAGEDVQNVTVADLRVAGGRDGVVATDTTDLAVEGVTATDQSRDGVAVDGARTVAVTGVTVTGSGRYGVYVDAAGTVSVRETSVAGTRHEAVEVLGGADVVLRSVSVEGVRGDDVEEPYDGVFVNVDGNVSIGNATVRRIPEGRGVYVYASAEDATVGFRDLTVRDTAGDGVYLGTVGATDLRVEDAAVVDAGGSALVANAFEDVRIGNSTFRNRGEYALRVIAASGDLAVLGVRVCGGAVALDAAGERTVDLDRTCPTVSDYATDRGVVDTRGLRRAITDWARGRIDTALLQRVIRAWATEAVVG